MADDLTLQTSNLATPPSGAVIATDDVSSRHFQRIKIDIGGDGATVPVVGGQLASSASLPAVLSTEQEAMLEAYPLIVAAASTLTRPANTTAYAALDAIADNGTAGSVTPLSFTVARRNDGPVALERMRLYTTDTGLALGKRVRAFIFRASPTPGAGDNAKFTLASAAGNNATFVGSMTGSFVMNDSDASLVWSDGGFAILTPDAGSECICLPTSGGKTVFALLQVLDAFTPSANSTTILATLEGLQGRA